MRRRGMRSRGVRQGTAVAAAGRGVIVLAVVAYFVSPPAGSTPAAAPTHSTTPSATPSAPVPSATVQPAASVSQCTYISAPPAARKLRTPPAPPDLKATYQAAIQTNRVNVFADHARGHATRTAD